jgi:signal transduction histidine kinase
MRRTFTVSREITLLGHDEQRRRLLRDLHDSIGPTLAAAALGVRTARSLVHKDRTSVEQILTRIEEELYSAVAEIRRLANGVHPPLLDQVGLVAAVRQYAERLSSRMPTAGAGGAQLRIEVEVEGELPALPAAVEVAAYRIVCEALTNVSRHSKARLCTVQIRFDHDLQLEIVDDGTGAVTDASVAGLPGGVGLSSMRERACSLGGRLALEEVAPCGTRVAATLPIGTG